MRNSGSAATYAFHSSRRIGADSLSLHSDARVIWKSYPIDTSEPGWHVAPCFRDHSQARSFSFNLLRPRKHAGSARRCYVSISGHCFDFNLAANRHPRSQVMTDQQSHPKKGNVVESLNQNRAGHAIPNDRSGMDVDLLDMPISQDGAAARTPGQTQT